MNDELFSVENKICIVTGGMGQIGKNFVEELYNRKAKVAVWARNVAPERIEAIFPASKYDYANLKFYQVDINDKSTMDKALDEMQAVWGDAPDGQ